MKNFISIILIVFVANTMVKAQCGVNRKEIMDKYCKGELLKSNEIRRDIEFTYVLSKGYNYSIYLLNPNGKVPDFDINLMKENWGIYDQKTNLESKCIAFYNYETKMDYEENYKVINFKTAKTGIYIIDIDFDEDNDNPCVLYAISLKRNINQDTQIN